MPKAAIVIDDWKLDAFKEILDKEGYEYERFDGPTAGCITLKVVTNDLDRLGTVLILMEQAAAARRLN